VKLALPGSTGEELEPHDRIVVGVHDRLVDARHLFLRQDPLELGVQPVAGLAAFALDAVGGVFDRMKQGAPEAHLR